MARLGASLLSVLAVAMPAAAQEEGDPVAGQELATQLCSACHIVSTQRVGFAEPLIVIPWVQTWSCSAGCPRGPPAG